MRFLLQLRKDSLTKLVQMHRIERISIPDLARSGRFANHTRFATFPSHVLVIDPAVCFFHSDSKRCAGFPA